VFRAEVIPDLVRQLLEQESLFAFMFFGEQNATVHGRENLDDNIMSVGRHDPNGLGAVDLVESSSILVFP